MIVACNNADKSTEVKKDSTAVTTMDTIKKTTPAVHDSSVMVTAKFVDFSLGDAPHFIFKGKDNTDIEFGLSEDSINKFAFELPEAQANANNQGWTANKKLQGKWFNIRYVNRKMVLYEGGPLEDTKVIVESNPIPANANY
jgi:hypothetical protein